MSILSVENISCKINGKNILNNINLQFDSAELISIIGPNGAGKSTLLKNISGIIRLNSGNILLNDLNVNSINRKEVARKMAYVPQQHEQISRFRVIEYILTGKFPHKTDSWQNWNADDYKEVEILMDELGITHLKERFTNTLSGGEFQLASIARAIIQSDQILLLDEITAHLDLKHTHQILVLLKKLAASGMTILLVMHDLNIAAAFSDRIILMDNGEIIADDKPEKVITPKIIELVYHTRVKSIDLSTKSRKGIFPVI